MRRFAVNAARVGEEMRGEAMYIIVYLRLISTPGLIDVDEKGKRNTSLTTVLWSRRSGLGTQWREFGGGSGGRRGGFAVR